MILFDQYFLFGRYLFSKPAQGNEGYNPIASQRRPGTDARHFHMETRLVQCGLPSSEAAPPNVASKIVRQATANTA